MYNTPCLHGKQAYSLFLEIFCQNFGGNSFLISIPYATETDFLVSCINLFMNHNQISHI